MILFASIVFALLCAWALIQPHVEAEMQGSTESSGALQILLDQKSRCLQLMKDLELDFSTAKVSEADYHRMRGSLSSELAALLARIDESTAG